MSTVQKGKNKAVSKLKKPPQSIEAEKHIEQKKNKGGAPKGNQFWKLRSKHGRDKLFKTPQLLWDAACEYFQWCEENPLYETKGFAFQGIVTKETFPKMRAMTMSQLCFYLHCNEAYFRTFKAQLPEGEQDFNTVIADIEKIIFNQKFQGAAADLLNANIIARDLGLVDKSEHTGKDGSPLMPATIQFKDFADGK